MDTDSIASGGASVASLSIGRRGRNAWLWGPEGKPLADVTLKLRPLPSAKGENSEELAAKAELASNDDIELALHSVCLSSSSLHFRHRLLSQQTQNGSATTSGTKPSSAPWVLEERLAPADLPAAVKVLKFLYTDELQPDSPSELVVMLKIADKWKALECVDACRVAFGTLKPEDIDLDVIKRVYSLEGIVNDPLNFSELLAATQSRLVLLFRDVVEVIRNPAVQAQMLQLPFAAMLALLRSDSLVVDCENSVVVVANLWVQRGRGRFTTPEQRKYLAGCIRLQALTPSYLCGVLPNVKWFPWPTANPGPYFATLQARIVSPEARQLLLVSSPSPAPPSSAASSPTSAPLSTAPRRQSTAGTGAAASASGLSLEPLKRVARDQNLELVCDIDYGRLTQYLTDGVAALRAHPEGFKGIHVHSECSYFRGFLWGIKVVFGFSSGADGEATPFVVTPSVFASAPPGEEGLLPLVTPVTVSFKCTLDAVGAYGSPYATATFAGASFMKPGDENVSSIGIANFFKKVAKQADPEAWRPFMYGGKLRLKLSVVGASVE